MITRAAFLYVQWPPGPFPLLTRRAMQLGALRLQGLSLGLVLAVLALPALGFAQAANPARSASAPAVGKPSAAASVKPVANGPSWAELNPLQQQALKPLALSWNTSLSQSQKRKWLKLSKNYPSLPPEEQATMHSRMNEWVSLSPQQRAQARLNFGKTKELSRQLTPEEKKAKWQTYQALSPEEKQKLAAKASPKPAGAATAVKPVAPQKLAVIHPHVNKPGTKPASKITPSQPPAASNPAAPRAGETATGGTGAAPQR
jgi:hypothetical protein